MQGEPLYGNPKYEIRNSKQIPKPGNQKNPKDQRPSAKKIPRTKAREPEKSPIRETLRI
jgi:hypothetical protein